MKLFEPISVGQMELKNRIAMPAIHHSYTPEGFVNERLIKYYETRARGGAGLITVGGCSIDTLGQGPMMIGLHDDQFIEGLGKLVRTIKENGAAAAAQLYHAGRYTHSLMTGQKPIAPSAVPSRLTKETPQEMTLEDIETVQENYVQASLRAKAAGFDAVEILASAGYLICQFLSPLTNQRTDQYGGSWENRKRFGLEVVNRVKEAVGNDYTMMVRISGHDFVPGSNSSREAALFAQELEAAGISCINVTGGWHESRVPQITGELPRGGFAYLARGIKEAVQIPVIASNRINDPFTAEYILKADMADLVNMGRPLIADPDLPRKAAGGKYSSIRRCIACNQGCFDRVFSLQDVHCTVNPLAGREFELQITAAETKRNILIIGGGPAGMETARVAAQRGHRVKIWEKNERLGGHLSYSAMPPGKDDFITFLDYYEDVLPRYGVEIVLNREASAGEIIAEEADVVVIATGGRGTPPPFPVKEGAAVFSSLQILDGTVVPGKRVVVIGGGSVGCETAVSVARMGTISAENLKFLLENEAETPERLQELLNKGTREVTLLELEKGIGRDIGISTRWVTIKCIRRLGITVLDQYQVKEVNPSGVVVVKEGKESLIPADTVGLAIGAIANNDLYYKLEGEVKELYLIGDALKPQKITEAVREGCDLGRKL